MADVCPMDGAELNTAGVCPTCGREWSWHDMNGERYLVSKKRRVQIVAPIVEGARLDDCIKPVGPTKTRGMISAMQRIAAGKPNNGRPLSGETARQIAREVLVKNGLDWGHIKGR